MNTAARIRKARVEDLGLTQKEFGAKIGVDAITVSRWERGVAEPSELHRVHLARLIGGQPDDYRARVAA